MATILHKRSSTPADVPTTGQLSLGEIAINTFDGKVYIKKDDGTEAVVEIGAGGGGGASVTMSDTAPGSPANGDLWVDTTEMRLYVYYNDGTSSQWASPTPAGPAGPTGPAGAAGTEMVTFSYTDLAPEPIPYAGVAVYTTLKSVIIPANTLQVGSRLQLAMQLTGDAGQVDEVRFAVAFGADPSYGYSGVVGAVTRTFSVALNVRRVGNNYYFAVEGEYTEIDSYGAVPIDIAAPITLNWQGSVVNAADDNLGTLSNASLTIFGATAAVAEVIATTWNTATVTVPGTFGGRLEHREVITDASVTPISQIDIRLDAVTTTSDDNEPEMLDLATLTAIPGTGNFEVVMSFTSRQAGTIKLRYEVN